MTTDLERARVLLASEYGLAFQGSLRQRLGRVVQLLPRVMFVSEHAWLNALVEQATIQESYVLRHPQQLEAIAQHVTHGARVWSAACARGEEALSVAIVLAEHRAAQILASDVSAEAIAVAKAGQYRPRSLRGLRPAVVSRHFVEFEGSYLARAELTNRIDYQRLNLACPNSRWPEALDAVLLRNVLFYFTDESSAAVLDRVRAVLTATGFLVVAPAEAGIVAAHGWSSISGLPAGCFAPPRPALRLRSPVVMSPPRPRISRVRPDTRGASKPVVPSPVLAPKDATAALARRLIRRSTLPDE